ncbi:barstar (barnase inhibitor) [Pontibacter ummariensis]|uniref:Barstar (Barnase inhibitor) n=1 Tax=Pontibacter ummariensis TaxID=1610492 RepID=A0A239GC83_9BACT|nr:barstar family protein [Pontibacter ummariensis]PRY11581.1 barstar (barnase inhibitor) [Pontibacter ummariensis]SNS65654.1 Barstar (barnase inhibitor) [Pontibacter ummariensis]
MAAFRNEPEEWQRLDWAILRNGWGRLYSKPDFLVVDVSWLRQRRYRVLEFDCATWADEQAMHTDLKQRFRFDESYGNNLDALRDGLADYNVFGAGLAVVLHHFDKVEKETGQAVLDVLAENARFHLLLGERVLTLVQVDDPKVNYKPVGGMPIAWNPQEWSNNKTEQ